MGGDPPPLSGYRAVWLFAMFDLPVDTKKARKRAGAFRKALQRRGFSMLQYSVYARYYRSEDAAKLERRRIRAALPPEGEVRLLSVPDRQFGKMETYHGLERTPTETAPEQTVLF